MNVSAYMMSVSVYVCMYACMYVCVYVLLCREKVATIVHAGCFRKINSALLRLQTPLCTRHIRTHGCDAMQCDAYREWITIVL